MLKSSQSLFFNIFLAGGGVLVALLGLEIGARLLPPPFTGVANPADICSTETGWRGKPNYTTTVATGNYIHNLVLNDVGMHDTDHALNKPANTWRILILGDSFMRAHQVKESETSHQLLEDLFNNSAESGDKTTGTQRIEVINSGVDGWGTGQELLYYRSEGRLYQPDVVVLMFFLGNDVKDNLPGRGVTVEGRNCYTPYFVLHGSQLDPVPWQVAPGLSPSLGQVVWGQKTLNNLLGNLHHHSYLYAQLEPLFATRPVEASMLDFYIGNNQTFDYALRLTTALVKQLHAEVAQDGAQFRVVLISPVDLVEFSRMNDSQRQALYQRLPAMKRAEQIEPPNQVLAKTFSSDAMPVLDLLPIFVQYINETDQTLYLAGDKHWNVAGHRLAAEAMYRWLQE